MNESRIRCPCCSNQIILQIDDTGSPSVFFDGEKMGDAEAFELYGVCLGLKGGELTE